MCGSSWYLSDLMGYVQFLSLYQCNAKSDHWSDEMKLGIGTVIFWYQETFEGYRIGNLKLNTHLNGLWVT